MHEFEDDVGLCRVGIEAGIPRLVVAFVEDNGIFALGYFQIGIRFCQTQCPGGGSFGRPVFGQGIGMYGDEQISFGVIGNFSAPVQGDEYVPVPRIDNFYIRQFFLICLPSLSATFRLIFFSLEIFPTAPGSCPPCPGSITTTKSFASALPLQKGEISSPKHILIYNMYRLYSFI